MLFLQQHRNLILNCISWTFTSLHKCIKFQFPSLNASILYFYAFFTRILPSISHWMASKVHNAFSYTISSWNRGGVKSSVTLNRACYQKISFSAIERLYVGVLSDYKILFRSTLVRFQISDLQDCCIANPPQGRRFQTLFMSAQI